jgi:hypothetical protein
VCTYQPDQPAAGYGGPTVGAADKATCRRWSRSTPFNACMRDRIYQTSLPDPYPKIQNNEFNKYVAADAHIPGGPCMHA